LRDEKKNDLFNIINKVSAGRRGRFFFWGGTNSHNKKDRALNLKFGVVYLCFYFT